MCKVEIQVITEKRKWLKPVLIVLIKYKSIEGVLSLCKLENGPIGPYELAASCGVLDGHCTNCQVGMPS